MAHLNFNGRLLEAEDGQTVLECLESHGVPVVSTCRAGVCQTCVMRATAGPLPAAAQVGLQPARKAQGYFLSCQCLVHPQLRVVPAGDVQTRSAQVSSVESMPDGVLRVRLTLEVPLAFRAGQFVQLGRPDGLSRPYSLANLPGEPYLELHVALLRGGRMSSWLASAQGEQVHVCGPQGDCFYMDALDEPLVLVGTGTGVAPLLGVVRAALCAGHRAPITLIHGAPDLSRLYLLSELRALADSAEVLRVLGSVLPNADGVPPQDLPADVVAAPIESVVRSSNLDLAASRIYLCGNPELVRDLKKRLYLGGASLDRIHSDPFVPAAPGTARRADSA